VELWAKSLSEFYEFGLRSNLWYTFDGASLDRLGSESVGVKKEDRTEAKHKGLSTSCGQVN